MHCNLHKSDQTCYEGTDASHDDDGAFKASPGAARREVVRPEAWLKAACIHDDEAWGGGVVAVVGASTYAKERQRDGESR